MLPSGISTRSGLLPPESGDTPAARTSGKRQIRRNQILNVLRQHGPVSRVEIARLLNFNFRTVSNLVDEMVADGLAIEQEAKKTALGRRPIPVSLNSKAASVLGIDVGKSSVIALMTDLSGEVIGRFERPSPLPLASSELASWIERFISEALKTFTGPIPPVGGIGIALPGLIHSSQSETKLLKPEADTIRKHLQNLFGVPVIVDNDARVMALGQLWFGNISNNSDSKLNTFVMINVGYGLGLGVVIKRNLYPGFHGHAGEIGHVRLGDPGIPCHCGGNSCLENVASGSGIERMAADAKIVVKGRRATAAEIAEMARSGVPEAKAIMERFARALARGVGLIVNLFNPDTIVLGGRVARSADLFLDLVRAEVKNQAYPAILDETKLIVSDLHENAASFGTCATVLHKIFGAAHVSVEDIL